MGVLSNDLAMRRWAEIYHKYNGQVDMLLWSEDIDLSGGPAEIQRAAGCLAPVTPGNADNYRIRSGYGRPSMVAAWATVEDGGGCVAAYMTNNKEVRNIYFETPFDLGDVAFLDFSDVGGMPLEEGSDMSALYDIATGAASQCTVCAMIYYPSLPPKDILPEGSEVEQIVSISASITPVANTLSFPGDVVISGFVAGADLPPGGRNRYAIVSVSTLGSTNSDSAWALQHPEYRDHQFIWPTTRAVAYSQANVPGPRWIFDGDNAPQQGCYGQAGGAAVMWYRLAVLA